LGPGGAHRVAHAPASGPVSPLPVTQLPGPRGRGLSPSPLAAFAGPPHRALGPGLDSPRAGHRRSVPGTSPAASGRVARVCTGAQSEGESLNRLQSPHRQQSAAAHTRAPPSPIGPPPPSPAFPGETILVHLQFQVAISAVTIP